MSELGEGIGTAVEGGLYARAIGAAQQADATGDQTLDHGHFAESACLNCGTALQGPHCHQCGQAAHLHRTVGAFLHDLLHGALHFEGKTWATLPKLAFKPGELTRRYIDGERKRFVSPMALFLFTIFLMFAIFQAIGLTTPTDIDPPSDLSVQLEENERILTQQRDDARARLAAMSQQPPANGEERAELEAQVASLEQDLAAMREGEAFLLDDERSPAQFKAGRTGIGFIDAGIAKWQANPGLMLYKLQANGYKFSWLLIPISVPFVWLLFAWKRKFRGYDHAVFVTYSIAFMTLFFIALSILIKVGAPEWLYGWLLVLVPPVHIYRQLRGTYDLSRFSALWRLAVLLVFVNLVALLFLNVLLVIGAF